MEEPSVLLPGAGRGGQIEGEVPGSLRDGDQIPLGLEGQNDGTVTMHSNALSTYSTHKQFLYYKQSKYSINGNRKRSFFIAQKTSKQLHQSTSTKSTCKLSSQFTKWQPL